MSETIFFEQKQPTINEQVERFTAIFQDLRKVLGVGFKHAHQQFIGRIHTILLAMSEEGRSSLLRGLEEFVQVGLSVQEIHSEEEM